MTHDLLIGICVLAALLPPGLLFLRAKPERDGLFWALLVSAVVISTGSALRLVMGAWHTGFSTALWFSIAASLILFAILAATTRPAWRLTPLLMPYLFLVGAIALVWLKAPERQMMMSGGPWLLIHIAVSVLTYALATLAAVAALAAFLLERALKTKNPTALSRQLPSVIDSEVMSGWLLVACEVVLGIGLLSGVATRHMEGSPLFKIDHKTLLSLLSFVVIGGLLVAHKLTGMRGRVAARLVLVGFLLLTLAYPGVKFVTDVILTK
jgi:ABC-type uncharacterized transport system permease subunit